MFGLPLKYAQLKTFQKTLTKPTQLRQYFWCCRQTWNPFQNPSDRAIPVELHPRGPVDRQVANVVRQTISRLCSAVKANIERAKLRGKPTHPMVH